MAKNNRNRKRPNGNKNGNKGNKNAPNNNKNKNKGNAPKKTGSEPLYEPNRALAGKDLKSAAWELVKGETKPYLKSINENLGQLGTLEKAALGRISAAGGAGAANITSYYDQLAQQETAFLNAQQGSQSALQSFLGQNAAQTQAALGDAQTAAQGSLQAADQPIASQARLAQMGAEYKDQAASNSQVQNAAAASDKNAQTQYAGALAQSGALRGGEELGGYSRAIANRLGETQNEFGTSRSELLGKKLEVVSSKPEMFHKALEALRKESRETYQGNKVLGIKEDEAQTEKEKANPNSKLNVAKFRMELRKLKAEENKRLKEIAVLGGSETEKREEENTFREKELGIQSAEAEAKRNFRNSEIERGVGAPSTEKGGTGGKGYWRGRGEASNYLQSLGVSPKELLTGATNGEQHLSAKQIRHKVEVKLKANGISPKLAKQVINKYVTNYAKKAGKDPNNSSLGR